jgi:hypothetical protein
MISEIRFFSANRVHFELFLSAEKISEPRKCAEFTGIGCEMAFSRQENAPISFFPP